MKSNPTTFRGTCVPFAIKRNSVIPQSFHQSFIHHLLLVAALLLFFALGASAQQSGDSKAAPATEKVVSNGYYSYVVTGNADVDAEHAAKAKLEFSKKHPDQYQKMVKEGAGTEKHLIDTKEFEAMPEEKRANILAHPELYIIGAPNQPK